MRMKKHRANSFLLLTAMIWALPSLAMTAEVNPLEQVNFVLEKGFVPAPYFSTVNTEGREVTRDTYEGKVVILNFWATWCPPCRLEMPSMEKLYREFEDQGLEIVAVNFMESPAAVKKFVQDQGLTYPVVMDGKGRIAELYGVRRLPETVLIGRRGNLLAKSVGYKNWYKQDVRDFVSLVLKNEEAVKSIALEPRAPASPEFTSKDRYLLLAFGLAIMMLLVYYVKKARAKKPDQTVHGA